MIKSGLRLLLAVTLVLAGFTCLKGQTADQDILESGTIREQMKYIEDKTRIYENFRAIREDMFQKIKENAVDSLSLAQKTIGSYKTLTGTLNGRIDSLRNTLNTTKETLSETIRTKERISVLGLGLNKTFYNTIMWLIVGILLFLMGSGFLAFRRNHRTTQNTKLELENLKKEFDDYRTKTRLERERVSMEHFKEMQKLKGR